ncbi:odorant receptor 94a-like [Anastrepha obliqua]|uniref:odorant receptor 94a-like n=1 Tax=Anastrepha obliqua TaxID=95512 RepID=UPI00240A0CB3|nr:odorant receptor 94a-like [Anastrepha obliqua]
MSFDTIANSRYITRVLTILGLWPMANGTGTWFGRYYRYYQFFLHLTFTFTLALLMWLEVVLSENVEYATQILKMVLTETCLIVKVLSTWCHARTTRELLHEWEKSEYLVPHTREERFMWRRAQRVYYKVMGVYLIWSISALILAFLSTCFMKTLQLPVPYWVPRKWRENNAWPTYVYDFLALAFTCLCNTEIDLFQTYLILHLTVCLRLCGMRLERLGDIGTDVGINRELVKIIQMHQRVRQMAKSCEKVVSLPVLAQIILSSMIICFTIYHLQSASLSDNPADFFAMLQYAIVMSLQIFLPCYFANELTVESQSLSKHLYNADWIAMSASNRRLIFLYMEYLKLPLVLHAGNYFKIGLPIFSKTMNNAYSLLALLVNVSDDGK